MPGWTRVHWRTPDRRSSGRSVWFTCSAVEGKQSLLLLTICRNCGPRRVGSPPEMPSSAQSTSMSSRALRIWGMRNQSSRGSGSLYVTERSNRHIIMNCQNLCRTGFAFPRSEGPSNSLMLTAQSWAFQVESPPSLVHSFCRWSAKAKDCLPSTARQGELCLIRSSFSDPALANALGSIQASPTQC